QNFAVSGFCALSCCWGRSVGSSNQHDSRSPSDFRPKVALLGRKIALLSTVPAPAGIFARCAVLHSHSSGVALPSCATEPIYTMKERAMAESSAIWKLHLIYRLSEIPARFDEAVRGKVRALAGVTNVDVAPSHDASTRLA